MLARGVRLAIVAILSMKGARSETPWPQILLHLEKNGR